MILLALASLGLAFASYAVYAHDSIARMPAQKFAEQYTMTLRRPEIVESLEYAPSSDFAIDLVADATLRDASTPVNLSRLSPEARNAWIESVSRLDEQMARAADLMLDAAAERPGWPYHAAMLGQLVYTRHARALSPELVTHYRRWSVPLRVATAATPRDAVLWQFVALAYLQTWPDLARSHQEIAPDVFRRAFADVEFVRNAFAPAAEIIGTAAAVASLPDSPKPLRAAFEQLAKSGQMDDAWRVHQRWDAAEWKQRGTDLAAVEHAAARGDVEQVRQRCLAWTSAHSVWDYDSPAAHAQAARILDLWPLSDDGRWASDPRGDVIRYFLSGRRDGIDGAILARAAGAVEGVPAATQAQLGVLAADIAGAGEIARRSESFGSFEWKPYLFELSRYWMRKGDRDKARAALAALPAAARDECEAIAAQVAADGGTQGTAPPRLRLTWSGRADIPLCLPKRVTTTLTLTLAGDVPVIVDYGWDRARSGSAMLSRAGVPVNVVLSPVEGMRTISVRAPSQLQNASVSLEVTPGS